MDLAYFLRERTALIRHFYDAASAPFIETRRLIEAVEPPFHDPPYDESGEPAYLEEWLQADVELELVGRACITMLSESIKHYLHGWERWVPLTPAAEKAMGSKGFVRAYVEHYTDQLGAPVCPADLDVIEQVVLARNSAQHNGNLVTNTVEHDAKTRAKYPRPFFTRPDGPDSAPSGLDNFLVDWVHVDRDKLLRATEQVEILADWLQEQIYAR
ncbi:hypothetical protein [Roseateles sp.]|uniref:hypothetical protein n=1 Tax=Roseateles sp. TaxID=1971397 RepID=UPI003BACBB33